jgi:acyl carrier protein
MLFGAVIESASELSNIMLDRTNSSAGGRIADIVAELLAKRAVTRPVGRDDDLRELLTSMDMVNLMLTVEAAFGLKLPDRAMTPANFRSLATIDALVESLQPKSQGGQDRLP